MIIKHIPGAEIPETNTDRLADVEAMILEKCEELRLLCLNARRQCIILVDANGKENGDCSQFWNIKMKSEEWSAKDNEKIEINTEERRKAFENILRMANSFIMSITQGQFGVLSINTYNYIAKTLGQYKNALIKIAHYDDQSIWNDNRDDASDAMLSVARNVLGEKE